MSPRIQCIGKFCKVFLTAAQILLILSQGANFYTGRSHLDRQTGIPSSCAPDRLSAGALLLFMSISCIHRTRSQAPSTIASDNSYLDLTPGWPPADCGPLLKEAGLPPQRKPCSRTTTRF